MKLSIKTVAITFALLGSVASVAHANIGQGYINSAIQSAYSGNGNVNVFVNGDTATLSGWTEDSHSRAQVFAAAQMLPGVENVQGQVFVSN